MRPKPITPFMHGIIDYTFAFALLTLPAIIKLNKKVRWLHAVNAISVLSYSFFTSYPPAIKQVIPLRLHKKLDSELLVLIALETIYKKIRKDKRAIAFQAGLLTTGITTVLLTDWNAE